MSISPNSGPRSGGTRVTIDGRGFNPNGETPVVLIGGKACSGVVVVHPTRLIAYTPNFTNVDLYTADVQVLTHGRLRKSNVLVGAFVILGADTLDLETEDGLVLETEDGITLELE